ncbi:coiled-coil domain-containing protein 157 isoform X2 [Phalacrocorax carbo]|uniref:coiled-coil domain-containing protein 157 isoform X2 n=1 Tax=Phalacrocorax carbo TaxID=9209 RepID=UPI00311A416E
MTLLQEWSGTGCPERWWSHHPWGRSKNAQTWHLGTWLRRPGGVGLAVDDPAELFQPQQSDESAAGRRGGQCACAAGSTISAPQGGGDRFRGRREREDRTIVAGGGATRGAVSEGAWSRGRDLPGCHSSRRWRRGPRTGPGPAPPRPGIPRSSRPLRWSRPPRSDPSPVGQSVRHRPGGPAASRGVPAPASPTSSMAHLLGHPGCMESLRADLRDLQAAIADVSSRAGAVRFPSWKFPDKVSCDLDLSVLLERYGYAESDPEFSQHSHVVLLELLIDRLLLLLQSFMGYMENLLSERAIPPTQAVGPCMSAGLTVRRYWCSMLKLGACYQQLVAEKAACRKEIPTRQSTSQAGKPEDTCLKHCSPNILELRTSTKFAQSTSLCPSLSVCAPDSDSSGSFLTAACSVAESSRSIPTQITRSSVGPCDACASAQAILREVGNAITSICQSQNIPSALSRFQEMVEESKGRRTLSAMDMSYWASEQTKDLSRISKHLQMLLQQVNPLKSKLEESEKQKDKLQKQVEDFSRLLQVEKETQAQQRKEAEQNLEVKNKDYLEAVARLEQDKDDLRRGAALLEEQFSTLKEELAAKQAAVQELEATKATLLEEMRTTMVARSWVLELEKKVQVLAGQRESLGQELSATTTQLEKEKAKVESMLRHQESLQAKQSTLLLQLDSLDQEREELQASLGEAEESTARLAEQLEESREQSRQQLRTQQELLDALQREKLSLEQSVLELQANISKLEEQTQELKERERLLVFFPELHIPAETQFESTGSLTEDMEKQLQANSIRISVLEQENVRLRSALAKVKVAAEQGVLKLVPQTQLWSQLSSQCTVEAGQQDAGRPSSRGSRDSTGMHGCTGEARQRALGSQQPKPLLAEPACKTGPCLSFAVEGLVLSPPKPRGRGKTPPLPSHRTSGHRK